MGVSTKRPRRSPSRTPPPFAPRKRRRPELSEVRKRASETLPAARPTLTRNQQTPDPPDPLDNHHHDHDHHHDCCPRPTRSPPLRTVKLPPLREAIPPALLLLPATPPAHPAHIVFPRYHARSRSLHGLTLLPPLQRLPAATPRTIVAAVSTRPRSCPPPDDKMFDDIMSFMPSLPSTENPNWSREFDVVYAGVP